MVLEVYETASRRLRLFSSLLLLVHQVGSLLLCIRGHFFEFCQLNFHDIFASSELLPILREIGSVLF